MDCLTFRKNIQAYMDGTLPDDDLNDFVQHLRQCPQCRDELEISFIVTEGIRILDEKNQDSNLGLAFRENLKNSGLYLKMIYWLRLAVYTVDTLAFWSFLLCLLLYLRICYLP